jgi:uncharacterized membrane protein
MSVPSSSSRTVLKYKTHWHVIFTHFPVGFFTLSFGLMALHLITRTTCLEQGAYLGLIAGTAVLLPTTLSGWLTWKSRYKGARGKLFLRKIRISYIMIGISIILVIWRSSFPDTLHSVWLGLYATGITLLLLGAMAEGYYGGRLNHR